VIDHVGNLSQLPRLQFDGVIHMTELTMNISKHIIDDSVKLHLKTIEMLNKHNKKHQHVFPFMNEKTKEQMSSMIRGYGYDKWIIINEYIKFKFIPNGHVSGSASIILEVKDGYDIKRLLFGGDTSCDRYMPYTKKLDLSDKNYKFTDIVLESTYGDNYVKPKSVDEMIEQLHDNIVETCIDKNGKYLLPVFSFARSTNVMLYLKKTFEKYPELKKIKIYAMSPLMCKIHREISLGEEFYDDEWRSEMDLFNWSQITMISEFKDVERIINKDESMIILASSGMSTHGVNNLVLPTILKSRKNKVSFTGFLADGTEGSLIINNKQKQIITYRDGIKETIIIRAKTDMFTGLSSHASGIEIIESLSTVEKKKVKNIIVQHGDDSQCLGFAKMLGKSFPNAKVTIPKLGQSIVL